MVPDAVVDQLGIRKGTIRGVVEDSKIEGGRGFIRKERDEGTKFASLVKFMAFLDLFIHGYTELLSTATLQRAPNCFDLCL